MVVDFSYFNVIYIENKNLRNILTTGIIDIKFVFYRRVSLKKKKKKLDSERIRFHAYKIINKLMIFFICAIRPTFELNFKILSYRKYLPISFDRSVSIKYKNM